MKNKPPQGRPLLIFGTTTTEKTVLQQLQLDFQAEIAVPNVNTQQQLAKIMQHSSIFSDSEIRDAIADIAESTGSDQIGVGVQRVLLGIQTASDAEEASDRTSGGGFITDVDDLLSWRSVGWKYFQEPDWRNWCTAIYARLWVSSITWSSIAVSRPV
jgi:hypothetical protein